jgi:hypothetical protein
VSGALLERDAPAQTRRKLSSDDRAEIVARVMDGGERVQAVADVFGVSKAWVGQIVTEGRKAARREAAEEASRDLDVAALTIRYRFALGLVESVDVGERWQLLASVVFPSVELLEASRERARAGFGDREPCAPCAGCGTPLDNYTLGCRTCTDRRDGRRKRERKRAAAGAAQ